MPKDVIERREAGGTIWRDQVAKLIRAEEDERKVVEELAARESDNNKLRIYLALTGRKVDKVTILNELLRYKGD